MVSHRHGSSYYFELDIGYILALSVYWLVTR